MSLKDKMEGVVSGWILKIGVKKGVKAGVTALVGLVGSAKVAPTLSQFGVSIDPTILEGALSILLTAVAATVLNYIKVKAKIGWL